MNIWSKELAQTKHACLSKEVCGWSKELAQTKHACLSKEVCGIQKCLDQIDKLESTVENSSLLTPDQQLKISRCPQLKADLLIFEPAVAVVEKD
jgi:hypothetical protein